MSKIQKAADNLLKAIESNDDDEAKKAVSHLLIAGFEPIERIAASMERMAAASEQIAENTKDKEWKGGPR